MKINFSVGCCLLLLILNNGCEGSKVSSNSPGILTPLLKQPSPEVVSSCLTKEGLWLIDYALNGNQLGYAVITGPSQGEIKGHSGMEVDSLGNLEAFVTMPDGSKISVWNSGRIFFFSGTNAIECPKHISGKTFKEFLRSGPSDYSMDALINFAESFENHVQN